MIRVSKPTFRHWRDVRDRKHLVYVTGSQNMLLACLSFTCSSPVQKRWASAAKARVYPGKRRVPPSNIPATAATWPPTSALLLHTLNQARLDDEDFLDLSGRVERTVRSSLASGEAQFQMRYFQSDGRDIPFPPDSHGFLYWHIEFGAPPVEGQVRFRITKSSDSATFHSGRDLHLPNGKTWNIPLSRIARRSEYSGLRAHLLSEKLVTAQVLKTALNGSPSSQDAHRIPKSDIPSTAATGLRHGSALRLRTLKRTRLDVKDFVDLTGRLTKTVHFPAAHEEPSFQMRYYGQGVPFSPESHGFFYWHLDPDAPPVSGQVRFRTTASSDPATFPIGHDLQLPDGRIWHISLFDIARRATYSGLRAHLLSEKLVTVKLLDSASSITAAKGEKVGHPATGSLLIWKFGQRFLVDFPSIKTAIWILGSSMAERLLLPRLFSVHVRESESAGICYVLSESSKSSVSGQTGRHGFLNGVDYTPFAGRALVQFERSTLPEHKGTRTVVLRILKVMKKSDGSDDASWTPEPQEDGLDMSGMHQHAWSVDVDQPQPGSGFRPSSAKALRILFDNEASQKRRDRRRAKS
ncbi:hypothetical protein OE88DRAFT_1668145 [Heliocybe sulcata]|uniref:Uncharacterized protein n=1 Tax=Heliocybe sulcata TaxID=5364 RepID=A0A5C3MXN5_9AGAM|nr:hypothetical protein OE88DRAFT_1668145 [Heliocybe sulcata]